MPLWLGASPRPVTEQTFAVARERTAAKLAEQPETNKDTWRAAAQPKHCARQMHLHVLRQVHVRCSHKQLQVQGAGGHIDVSVCDGTTCNKTYIRPANNLLQLSQAHTLTSVAENRRMCASTASGRTCLQETKDCDHLVQNPKHTHTPANCTPTNCFDPINCFDQHNGRDTQDPNLTACKSAWGPGTPFPPAKTQPTNDLKLKSVSNSMRCL